MIAIFTTLLHLQKSDFYGSIPYTAKKFEDIPEKECVGNAEYINEIDYEGYKLNLLRYREETVEKR